MITVVDYNHAWPDQFETLRQEYAVALAASGVPVVAIEHIGSTAVSGLAAKPIIDCDVVVVGADVGAATSALIALGFSPLGELGIPQRWAFREPPRPASTHTYVIVEGSLALRNHLCLRDTLRQNAELRDRYGELKRQVAASTMDIEQYGQGKNSMIQEILAVGGLSPEELTSINSNQVPSLLDHPR